MRTSALSREETLALLEKYNKEPFHIQHALTVEGVMRFFAKSLGYNLGVIDNKQTGSSDPVNETEIDVSLNNCGKTLLYLLMLILLIIILAPIMPYILQFVVWIISLPIKGIAAIGKSVRRKRQERKERQIYEKVVATIDKKDFEDYD